MRPSFATAVAMLGALAASAGLAREAQALVACTAAQVNSQDPGCPSGTGPCSITKLFDVADGCILDFTTRAVTVTAAGTLRILSGAVTLKAGSYTMLSGSLVDGRGNLTTPPRDRGGMFTVQTTGSIDIQKAAANGVIDVTGNIQGGVIVLEAGGNVTVAGKLLANNLLSNGGGGAISIRAGGDFTSLLNSQISIGGGILSSGGSMDVRTGGKFDQNELIDLAGGDGGFFDLVTGAEALLDKVDVFSTGDAGSGGCVGISGGTRVDLRKQVNGKGNGSATGSGGGCGGFLDVEARFGDLTVSDTLLFEGADPDGGGGGISLIARGSINVPAVAVVSSRGVGPQGCGGEISLDAGLDIVGSGTFDASGGFGGNLFDATAGRNITLGGLVDVSGLSFGSFGGAATISAGAQTKGTLDVQNRIDVDGGGCDEFNGCGVGGFMELSACDLTISSTGSLSARASEGGQTALTARAQLTVQGPVDATSLTLPTQGSNGTNTFAHAITNPPVISATVAPAATLVPMALCTTPGQPSCVIPCPNCGNGAVEFPEACDTLGAPQSCDGCSVFCQVENCNDSSPCTADSCDPNLGCRHVAAPDGTSCSDGTVCNGTEQCSGGVCLGGTPLNCTDNNPCTTDVCDPILGCTVHLPGPPGVPCNDNNFCTVGDSCNALGVCQPGATPLTCNDSQECTNDTCNPATGCVFTPRTGACTDDGNECTNDTCAGGACTHPARTGTCTDDGNECTTDTCSAGVCTHPGRLGSCTDDGNVCTGDTCSGGVCTHPPASGPCPDDGNECTTDTCSGGACTHPARLGSCTDDGNVCTGDTCSGGVCTHPAGPNGTPCNDGAFCTVNDTCQSGTCAPGPARNCADTNTCTADGCDELADTCTHTAIVPCCGNGTPEATEQCDDGNTSNSDACLNTCVSATCGDGFVRTGVEQCDLGAGNSNAPNALCRPTCQFPRCGDGVVDNLRGEQCDDGNTSAGDGCAPGCFSEPPSTADRIPGKGAAETDCGLEWAMDSPILDRLGVPSIKQACQDGDIRCDYGTTSGECTFHVWVCANNNDPRLIFCTPGAAGIGTMNSTEATKPNSRDAGLRPEDASNRQELLRAAAATQVTTFDTCGPRMDIRVPLKTPIRKGVKTLKLKGLTTKALRESDTLKLFCLP